MRLYFAMVLISALAGQAQAQTPEPCAAAMVCAQAPQTVVAALQAAGYKAKLDKDSTGDPHIMSSASGYDFELFFYGCEKNANCSSVQFIANFKPENHFTPKFANDWNAAKRFIQMSVNDKKELILRYDLTTVGGMTSKNFADALDWWAVMLGNFDTYQKDNKPKA